MAYKATVIPIMIASPGDVFEEREIIREVIHTWNYVHSLRTQVVLMPIGWETHSSPELGSRAQELINSRVLKDCDILIGVLWTRLGSPTGKAASGTVEEIQEHIKAGKPAMIYFSSKPVAPQSIDQEQYQALQVFKTKCKSLGLVESFDNAIEFREKVSRQLQLCLNNNPYIQSIFPNDKPALPDDGEQGPAQAKTDLSEHAQALLKAAAKDDHGQILRLAVMAGRFIQAGGSTFGGQGGRESAKWERALEELVEADLVVARGHKGEVFELTHAGWELADQISE